jgi:Ulp1 family protease
LREELLVYLKDEAQAVGCHFDESEWDYNTETFSPQQGYTVDCGLYALMTVELLASNISLKATRNGLLVLSEANMPYFRRKIAADICRIALLY